MKLYRSILLLLLSIYTPQLFAQNFTLRHDNEKRRFIVHLPKGYDKTKSYPVVLNFHGLGSTAKQQRWISKMNRVSNSEQFIVVYPKAIDHEWNTGIHATSYRYGRDDVGFVDQLLDTLIARYSIDTQRVYSTGFSLGGYFSYRLACQLSTRIAAIASVSGVMTDSTAAFCNAERVVPVLQIHGTTDPVVSYKRKKDFYGVEETLAYWIKHDGCSAKSETTDIPNIKKHDHSTVQLIKYNNCNNHSAVWFYKITGGGHTWPGGRLRFLGLGHRNMDLNASQAVWDFLKQFRLNGSRVGN
jgi:polyhydroxybutyrate depolymerase